MSTPPRPRIPRLELFRRFLLLDAPILVLLALAVSVTTTISLSSALPANPAVLQTATALLDGGDVQFAAGPLPSWLMAGALWITGSATAGLLLGSVILATVTVWGLWVAARMTGASRAMSLALTILVVNTTALTIWPLTAAFAAVCAVMAIVAVFRWPTRAAWGWASVACWIAASSRQEYVYLAMASTALWLFVIVFRRSRLRPWTNNDRWSVTAALLSPLIVIGGFGFVQSRDFFTSFQQSYALGQVGGNAGDVSTVMSRDFGTASDLLGAALYNSQAFFGHMWSHLWQIPGALLDSLLGQPDVAADRQWPTWLTVFSALFLATIAILILTALPTIRRHHTGNGLRPVAWTLATGWALTVSMSLLIVGPSSHLIFALTALLAVLGAAGWQYVYPPLRKWVPAVAIGFGTLGLLMAMMYLLATTFSSIAS